MVSYTKYIQKVLPPPYSDGGFTHVLHMKCIDLCINGQLEPLNKSLTSIFYYPNKKKFVTFADRVQNRTFNTWLNGRLNQCEEECEYPKLINHEAEMEFTVTEITEGRTSLSATVRQKESVLTSFYVRSTYNPVCIIQLKAQISFFEFIITTCSIISIWFGLCVRSIPLSIFTNGRKSVIELVYELEVKYVFFRRFLKDKVHQQARLWLGNR